MSAVTDTGDPTPPVAVSRSLWRNRDYMFLWSGQLVSTLGTGVSSIAFPLLVLALTHSAAQAGLLGAFESLPYLIFSLPAGALVDRWDRKRVMVICDTGRALSLISIPLAALLGRLTVPQLYVVTLIDGTLYVFFNLAEVACLPRVVPKAQLPQASAQNEGGSIAAGLIGPPLGTFLFGVVGRTIPFLVDAVSYAASVVTLLNIRTEFQEERAPTTRRLRAEIAEGLAWLWRQPLIRFMAVLTGGINLVNAASTLLVIIIARDYHVPDALIGVIISIGSLGGIVGALLAPRIQRRFGFGAVITATVWLSALLWPLYAVVPNPLLLGVVTAGLYIMGPIYNAVQFSYRISIIPDALQGRVNSSFRLLAFGGQPIGAALSGFLIAAHGAVFAVLVFWGWYLLLAVLTTLNPHIRRATGDGRRATGE